MLLVRITLSGTLKQVTFSFSQKEARDLLSAAPGVTVIDDRASNTFPTPLDVSRTTELSELMGLSVMMSLSFCTFKFSEDSVLCL